MLMFLLGAAVGAAFTVWIAKDEAKHLLRNSYSYEDVSAAWKIGREGGPPVPPRPQ